MKAITIVLALCILMTEKSWACFAADAASISAIDQTQANKQLSSTLFNRSAAANDIAAKVKLADCDFANMRVNLDNLSDIRQALKDLGQVAIAAKSPEQKRAVINALNSLITRDAGSGFIQLPTSSQESVQINLYSQLLDSNCSEVATLECAQSAQAAANLWRIAGDFRSFANTLNASDKSTSLAFIENIDTQWRSYKDDTIKLWPQEVLLSSLSYSPSKRGLSTPPNYKLLALRPSLGLSYLSDQSHRVQPTINMDLLGVYWWKYGDDNKAQAGRGISASLIWDGDDTAYGLSYHHNPKWSVTLAKGDENDVVVSISFQLAHWLLNK